MFKASQACRSPHLNVDVLRAELHRSELLRRHQIRTADQLVEWIEQTNRELGSRTDSAWRGAAGEGARTKSDGALTNALAKAKEHQFWLGLGYEWLTK